MHLCLRRRRQAALLLIAFLLFIAALGSSELLIAALVASLLIAAGAIAQQRSLSGKRAIDPGRKDLLTARTSEAIYASGDTFIAAAHARGNPASILIFEQVDLPELHVVFGPAAATAAVAKFNQKLAYLAGANGLAGRLGPTTWAVLLPGHAETVLNRVKGFLGKGLATEVEGSEEILLVPRIAVHTATIEKVAPMRQICDELHEQVIRGWKLELRREDYLRRERESHSLRAKRLTRPPEAAPAGIFAGGGSTRNSRVTSRSIEIAHSGHVRRKTAERLAMSSTAGRGEQPIESCS